MSDYFPFRDGRIGQLVQVRFPFESLPSTFFLIIALCTDDCCLKSALVN